MGNPSHGLSNQPDQMVDVEGKIVVKWRTNAPTDHRNHVMRRIRTLKWIQVKVPTSNPIPPESKPKPKHPFVKIVELGEEKMLTLYLECKPSVLRSILWCLVPLPPFPV